MNGDIGDVASEVRGAVGRFGRQLRRLFAEAAQPGDVTFLELAILDKLHRAGPLSVSQMARGERVTTQAISAVVRQLRERGLVEVTKDPLDRRRTVVTANERAQEVMAQRDARVVGRLSDVLGEVCSAGDLAVLRRAAAVLNSIADRL